MGLDFTNIPDRDGAAFYILHNQNSLEIARFQRLADEITKTSNYQTVLVDVNSPDGEQVRDFYDIVPEQVPVGMIIADDDTVSHQWFGEQIPSSAGDVLYHLRQISA